MLVRPAPTHIGEVTRLAFPGQYSHLRLWISLLRTHVSARIHKKHDTSDLGFAHMNMSIPSELLTSTPTDLTLTWAILMSARGHIKEQDNSALGFAHMNMSIPRAILTSTPIDWCAFDWCGIVGAKSLVRSRWCEVVGVKSLV